VKPRAAGTGAGIPAPPPDRRAAVIARRVDVQRLDTGHFSDQFIRFHVEECTAGSCDVRHSCRGKAVADPLEHQLLEDLLTRCRDVVETLASQLARQVTLHARGDVAGAVAELQSLDREGPAKHVGTAIRLAIRGHAHDLVFVLVRLQSQVRRDGRIHPCCRAVVLRRPRDHLQVVIPADVHGGAEAVAGAVEREHGGRPLPRPVEVRGGGMAEVMVEGHDGLVGQAKLGQAGQQFAALAKPRQQPAAQSRAPFRPRQRRQEIENRVNRLVSRRRHRGANAAAQRDQSDVFGRDARLTKDGGQRLRRHAREILGVDAPLFRAAQDEPAIAQEANAGIVAVVDSKNDHRTISPESTVRYISAMAIAIRSQLRCSRL
jgi:hypothetical protein